MDAIAGMARSYAKVLRSGRPSPSPTPRGRGDSSVQDEAMVSAGTICSLSLWERAGVRGIPWHRVTDEDSCSYRSAS